MERSVLLVPDPRHPRRGSATQRKATSVNDNLELLALLPQNPIAHIGPRVASVIGYFDHQFAIDERGWFARSIATAIIQDAIESSSSYHVTYHDVRDWALFRTINDAILAMTPDQVHSLFTGLVFGRVELVQRLIVDAALPGSPVGDLGFGENPDA